MAGADDDIEKLLREVEASLGGKPSGGAVQPVRPAAVAKQPSGGRLAEAVPRATAIGAAWGVGVGGLFLVLPFLHSISGAAGAFVAAFSVSFLGRLRKK
jgi:hypothetical protein